MELYPLLGFLLLGVVMAPVLIAWGCYCLSKRPRRAEGIAILGGGLVVVCGILVASFLTTRPEDSLGIFRVQALVVMAGEFGVGAAAGKAVHFAISMLRRVRRAG